MRHDETRKLETEPRPTDMKKNMSRDSLETSHVSRDSITASCLINWVHLRCLLHCTYLFTRMSLPCYNDSCVYVSLSQNNLVKLYFFVIIIMLPLHDE